MYEIVTGPKVASSNDILRRKLLKFCTEYLSNIDAIRIPVSVNINQKVRAPIPRGQAVIVDSNF